MKKLTEYNWDQLHSYRYDMYPYRLIVVSPLSYETVKFHFREYVIDETMRNKYTFDKFLEKKTQTPAIAAIFYDAESRIARKQELFEDIATMTQRVKAYSLFR
jgi:hypothetical protein